MRDRSPAAPPTGTWAGPTTPGPPQPGGSNRVAASAVPGERLPQAPRERKPALAALAVLLILGGALGSATLVLRSGKTTTVIEVARDVPAGVHLSADDLREAEISDPNHAIKTIPWAQRGSVLQYYAASALTQGSLLVPNMVSSGGASRAGTLTIGLSMSSGQMPDGLHEGDHIQLYSTDPATPLAQRILTTAVIVKVSQSTSNGSGGDTVLTVVVGEDVAATVLLEAKSGNIVAALLPAGSPSSPPAQQSTPSPATPTPAGPTAASPTAAASPHAKA